MLTNTSFQGNKRANTFVYGKTTNYNTSHKHTMTRNIYYCLDDFSSKWKAYLKNANFQYFGEHKTTGLQYNLFGIDIMVDYNLKPYVIEINSCPAFSASSSSPKIATLKKNMWKDICSNFIDHFAEHNTTNQYNTKFIEIGQVINPAEVSLNIVDKSEDDLISEKDINHKNNLALIAPLKAKWEQILINPF